MTFFESGKIWPEIFRFFDVIRDSKYSFEHNFESFFESVSLNKSSLNAQQESSPTSLIIEERSKKKRNKKKSQSDQTGEANSSSLENASKSLSNLLIYSGENLIKIILMFLYLKLLKRMKNLRN